MILVGSGKSFDERFLTVGARKWNINSNSGFDKGKAGQFQKPSIARYVGASFEQGEVKPFNVFVDNKPIMAYPNPNAGRLTIETSEPLKVSIYSETGALMKIIGVHSGKSTISLETLPDGTYILKGEGLNSSISKKIVLAR